MRKKRMAVLIAILTAGNVWGCGNPGLSESAVMGQTADYSKEEPETVREENSSVPWTSVAAVDSRTHPMIAFEDAAPEVRDAVEQYQEEKYREDRSFLYLQKLSVLWENEEETVLYAYEWTVKPAIGSEGLYGGGIYHLLVCTPEKDGYAVKKDISWKWDSGYGPAEAEAVKYVKAHMDKFPEKYSRISEADLKTAEEFIPKDIFAGGWQTDFLMGPEWYEIRAALYLYWIGEYAPAIATDKDAPEQVLLVRVKENEETGDVRFFGLYQYSQRWDGSAMVPGLGYYAVDETTLLSRVKSWIEMPELK